MKAITTCVNFADLLAVTLAPNARHFQTVLVVTAPGDEATLEVVRAVPNARAFTTEVFHADRAPFDKGRALDASLEVLGKHGWIVIWDADILMPAKMDLSGIECGNLYSPHRRMCDRPGMMRPEDRWDSLLRGPEVLNDQYAGYFQLFHAKDPGLDSRPWHGTEWKTAQGADTVFQDHWPPAKRKRLPFDVLHLGLPRLNWYGRVTPKWEVTR